jgi:hypothetical protein
MTTKPDDGGPAFPHSYLTPEGPTAYDDKAGMTLRDYFAGQTLAGFMMGFGYQLANDDRPDRAARAVANVARLSFVVADAMLKERDRADQT